MIHLPRMISMIVGSCLLLSSGLVLAQSSISNSINDSASCIPDGPFTQTMSETFSGPLNTRSSTLSVAWRTPGTCTENNVCEGIISIDRSAQAANNNVQTSATNRLNYSGVVTVYAYVAPGSGNPAQCFNRRGVNVNVTEAWKPTGETKQQLEAQGIRFN